MTNLNPSQYQAVIHQNSHLLVVAGPGTGKTHTLTHRIVHLSQHLSQEQTILAITFTHKAADEMRHRLSGYITDQECCTTSTFHQFCLQILRQYSGQTDCPENFTVASEEELQNIVRNLWPDDANKDRKNKVGLISRWKSSAFDEPKPDEVAVYDRALRDKSLVDFDDLLWQAVRLLREHEEVLKAVQSQYPYIFVDEYQDINAIQQVLLKLLVGANGYITAIGDPNQAIYGFRGSDVRFFHHFVEDFPGATVLSLSDNYRSAKNILSASGQMIGGDAQVNVPALTVNIYAAGRLVIKEAPTDKAEAEYVVHTIEQMVGGTSMFSQDSGRVGVNQEAERSFGDMVVLYRLKSQCSALKKAFERSGIPFHIVGEKKDETDDEICPTRYEDTAIDSEKVCLMTIHASKGLEFPVVFIVGCEQNMMPLNLPGLASDIAEERRLFYVGMTRAKEQLFLVRAKQRFLYGKKCQHAPSIFLSDIEEQLKEYEKTPEFKRKVKKEDAQLNLF